MQLGNMKSLKSTTAPQTNTRFKEDLEKRIAENKAYNENILEDKALFDSLEILDGKVIIRLLKHVGEQDNDGLLLERKFKAFETEGGKPASKIENWDYAMKAVIIKKPEQDYLDAIENKELKQRYNNINIGDTVWLPMSLMHDTNAVFIHERNYPVEGFAGYLSVHVGVLQMKEKKVA